MALPKDVLLRTMWGGRAEDWDVVSDRIWATLTGLKPLGPVFGGSWIELQSAAVVSESRAALDQVVAAQLECGNSVGLISIVHRPEGGPDWIASAQSRVGHAKLRLTPNYYQLSFRLAGRWPPPPFPVDQVLSVGREAVGVLIDAWEPDNISITAVELVKAHKGWGLGLGPTVGFVSWFGDRIVKSDLSVLEGVTVERDGNGTLVSLDLTSETLLEDGLALVKQVREADVLLPLPDAPAA